MHDWVLKSVLFEWKEDRVTFVFENLEASWATITAEDVVDLHIPQKREWGPSVSINKLTGPCDIKDGLHKLEIEMQSGDVITITARTFDFPKT